MFFKCLSVLGNGPEFAVKGLRRVEYGVEREDALDLDPAAVRERDVQPPAASNCCASRARSVMSVASS